jgi:hypothetical protein
MNTDYTELSDKQLRQRISDINNKIADAVAVNQTTLAMDMLFTRGELLRELKRRNLKEDET